MVELKKQEQFNQILADRFYNKKIKYALSIKNNTKLFYTGIQIFFDEITCCDRYVYLKQKDEVVTIIDKSVFKIKFVHYVTESNLIIYRISI